MSVDLKSQAVVSSAPPPRALPSTRATEMRGNLHQKKTTVFPFSQQHFTKENKVTLT